MSITDELRMKLARRLAEWKMTREEFDEYAAIADRIDEQHAKARGKAYNEGVYDGIDADKNAMGYVKLPVDADGMPIHIGDEMEGVDKYDSLKKVMGKVITVSFESDGIVDVAIRAWNSDGKSWHRAYLDPNASVYRHHHEPTVEDVLREFAQRWDDPVHYAKGELVEQYAAKLRLAGEAE